MIRARRADGYHEIETQFVPLGLFDTLDLRLRSDTQVTLEIDPPGLPTDQSNLAVEAALRGRAALGLAEGVELRLRKQIPVAAGLGGGSSDAAGVLLGLEALVGRSLSEERRRSEAVALGADVPFFLDPRPSRGSGVGERLQALAGVPERWWVLAILPFEVSTAEAYAAASLELTLPRDDSSIAALLGPHGVDSSPHNDLETVTARRHPQVGEAREALREVGALVCGMSGSGPTVYGEFEDRDRAERAAGVAQLPQGTRAIVVSSPGSDATSWGWGVAKW